MNNILECVTSRRAIAGSSTTASFGLLLLRIGAGAMIITHGWGKLARFGERSATFSDPLGVGSTMSLSLAVFAEFFCGVAVILGLLTRLSTIPLIITMFVAGVIVHANDPWPKPELALVYMTIFVALFFVGPGKYSVDRLFHK